MARNLSRTQSKRLRPIEQIEWLSEEQKIKNRTSIKLLTSHISRVEEGATLNDNELSFLRGFTGSDNSEVWLDALWDSLEKTEKAYYDKLAAMAQHDLGSYHEFMRPDEPPAYHHQFLCKELMAAERGELGFLGISMNPGSAKPVASKAYVATLGGRKRLRGIKVGDYVLTHKGRYRRVSATHKQGVLSGVTLYIGKPGKLKKSNDNKAPPSNSGSRLTAAYDHPFLTATGWKNAGDLRRHELLFYPHTEAVSSFVGEPTALTPDDLYVMGAWLGDGCVSENQYSFANTDFEFLTQMQEILDRRRVAYSLYKHQPPAPRRLKGSIALRKSGEDYINSLSISDQKSVTKCAPDFVARLSDEHVLAFLAGQFMTDGGFTTRESGGKKHTTPGVRFSTVSRRQAEFFSQLCRRFGLRATMRLEPRSKINEQNIYRVVLTNYDAARFSLLVSPWLTGYKRRQYEDMIASGRMYHARPESHLSPCLLHHIVEATPTPMMCLTVEEDHSFVAGGVVVRNSSYGSRSFVQWFMGRNPNKRVLAVGHGQQFVEHEFSKPNRDAIDTDEYRQVFPDVSLSETDRGATTWKLENWRGMYVCRGAGAGVAGIRANLLDIDDPIKSVADAMSEIMRERISNWITADLLSRRLPGAPIILIMTRWHSQDPMGRLEQLHKDDPTALPGPVKFINIPAQAEDDDPLGRAKGEWLWQEFYGEQHYLNLRSTMPAGLWSALYLGVPLDKMGEFVAESDFQRYDAYPTDKVRKTVISVDTAQKATERSARTAIQVFREGFDGQHYLCYAQATQSPLEEVIKILGRLVNNWSANYILIEDAGQGSQILENYANAFACPIVSFSAKNKGSKEFMFDAAVPWIKGGKILFPKNATWLADLLNEMVAFPNGKYKDQVDAFSQYCHHALVRRTGGTKRLIMGA